jgi:hypothetical protein
MTIRVGMLQSRIRVEERLLAEELTRRGVELVRFDDREFTIDILNPDPQFTSCDVVHQPPAGAVHVAYP